MKVTTELKNIVKCAFKNKASEYRKQELEMRDRKFKLAVEWIANSTAFQEYVAALKRLEATLKPNIEAMNTKVNGVYPGAYYYQFDFSKNASPYAFIQKTSDWRIFENDENLEKLEKEQNALLVKLTYEKDMDRIQELLSSYGIEL